MWRRLVVADGSGRCRWPKSESAWASDVAYTVSFKTSAVKQLRKLPKPLASRILAKTTSLSHEPRPSGSVKLVGGSNLWRIRIGDYRVIYAIDDGNKKVDVRIVAHRREVYRDV